MRKVKKLLGLLLAAVMVLAMGVPTFAASGSGAYRKDTGT